VFFLFRIARRIITAVVLIAILVPLFVAVRIWDTGHVAHAVKSDAIVILGAAQYNGRPSDLLDARINDAMALYKKNFAPRILTVGAAAKGDVFSEAQSSANGLAKGGISRAHIGVISVGRDTLSSTIAYASYMKAKNYSSVIIATDPYHCYRAIAMAGDLGLHATCAPTQKGPGTLQATGIRYIIRETGAYLAYKTVGRFGIHLTDQVKK
jgi:vancomycin permeability regulator SanA